MGKKRARSPETEKQDEGSSVKRIWLDADGLPVLHVALTGAKKGDVLEGSGLGQGDTEGVLLEVVEGQVSALGCYCERVSDEALVKGYMKAFSLSECHAKQAVSSRSILPPSHDNASPMGCGCPSLKGEHDIFGGCSCSPTARFKILQPGKAWMEHFDNAGNLAVLNDWVAQGTPLTWRDILSHVGNKKLLLRRKLYKIGHGPRVVDSAPSGSSVVCATFKEGGKNVLYEVKCGKNALFIEADAPLGAASPVSRETTVDLAHRALAAAFPSTPPEREAIMRCYDTLHRFAQGALKSAMQKVVRFRSDRVKIDDQKEVETPVFAAVTCVLLGLGKGGFVPELQIFTRGITAALKRAAVVLVEDGYAGSLRDIEKLLGLALVTQKVPHHHPPLEALVRCASLMALASRSQTVINWRRHASLATHLPAKGSREWDRAFALKDPTCPPLATVDVLTLPTAEVQAAARCTTLLMELGSLPGDKLMLRTVELLARHTQKLPVRRLTVPTWTSCVPQYHIWDQHCQRGIGHLVWLDHDPPSSGSFKQRFAAIFNEVTGVNPRLASKPLQSNSGENTFEMSPVVRRVRMAQRCIHRFAQGYHAATTHQSKATPKTVTIQYRVHPGTLAAGVGTFRVCPKGSSAPRKGSGDPTRSPQSKRPRLKGEAGVLLCMLGTERAEEEVIMAPPGRDIADLYNTSESAEVTKRHEAARQELRQQAHPVRSPLLPPNKKATFSKGMWHFGGTPWSDIVGEGLRLEVPVSVHMDPPHWKKRKASDPCLLHDDVVIEASILYCLKGPPEGGMVPSALDLTDWIISNPDMSGVTDDVLHRAIGVLRQQYHTVSLPTPSLDGGLGTDQLQAYPGDWDVYRFIILLARLFPGALRPIQVPRFKVLDAVLLSIVLQKLSGKDEEGEATLPEGATTPWGRIREWQAADSRRLDYLKQHQIDAVERMWDRSLRRVPGHYVVMDTGLGKTATALSYFIKRLVHTQLGNEVDKIVWLTPAGSKATSGRSPTGFTLLDSLLKELRSSDKLCVPCEVITPTGKQTVRLKPYAVNIIAHHHLIRVRDLLRTEASRCVMVFDEVDEMYNPTQRTSAALLLAGVCKEFVAQTATPISKTVDMLARWLALTEEYPVEKSNYLVAASSMVSLRISLGIKRTVTVERLPQSVLAHSAFLEYKEDRNWLKLARTIQRLTDRPLCASAAQLAREDAAAHPNGGVLVVADNAEHANELVTILSREFGVRAGTAECIDDPSYRCVVVTKANNRGYNQAIRLGALVRGVYAGNGAARHQMDGRIARIGQVRKEVHYRTVVMKDTILDLLHERQTRIDSANISLEQLARVYEASVLGS
eukprot:Sspe_Gene.755::Locus_254_Transcript_1_1_Confidence_1.000_Length_4159::g.755::m.755